MAQAPALKGSVSFLDITPSDVQSGFARFGVESATTLRGDEKGTDNQTTPGDETDPEYNTIAVSADPSRHANVTPISKKQINTVTASRHPQRDQVVTSQGDVSSPGPVTSPVLETYIDEPESRLTPGRGRSKVRRCVLAQDGHSLGEEAIYQVLWRSGRQEGADPNGSRAIRMGAADIGFKVNMAKKNVRQNISKLFEKLALEILEDFETMSSQARLYRVYSYKQILERRRAAGLEYVLRNKGVVFCSKDGVGLVSSPAYVTTPGDESIKPAAPKKRRLPVPSSTMPSPPFPGVEIVDQTEDEDLVAVSQALNRYWPVDQPAAVQLLKACRRVRPDARASEISFFVLEKLELARQNRAITNPTGLILSTVPQSFVGSTFLEFRKRMERQAALAAEETARKLEQEAELNAWVAKELEKAERIASDETVSQKERDAAERTLRQLRPREY